MSTNFYRQCLQSFVFLLILGSYSEGSFAQNNYTPNGGAPGGAENTGLGATVLQSTTGSRNTAMGYNSMQYNIGGSNNSAFGQRTLRANVSGIENTAIGYRAMELGEPVIGNTGIGYGALSKSNGSYNTSLGYGSGSNMLTGDRNIFIGYNSGLVNTGNYNVIIGKYHGGTFNSNIILATGGNDPTPNTGDPQGSIRMLINEVGNAGFGTTSPQNKLDVEGAMAIGAAYSGTNTAPANGLIVSGAVGIGTAAPGTLPAVDTNVKVEIFPNFNNTSGLRFGRLNSATTTGVTQTTNGKFLSVDAEGDVILQTIPVSSGQTFLVNGTNTIVTGNGSAATPFEVNASFTEVDGSVTNEIQTLGLSGSTLTLSNGGGSVTLPGSVDTSIYANDGAIGNIPNTLRTVNMNNGFLVFDTSTSPTNGKIYIGSNSVGGFPAVTGNSNYKLFVEGGILTEKVKVAMRNTSNWADHVFAADYNLMPLNEVEAFIQKNNHLPGIQSAAELVQGGLDLSEMQAKQMEKIEELTLHLIEQNKALARQAQEIAELKEQMKAIIAKK